MTYTATLLNDVKLRPHCSMQSLQSQTRNNLSAKNRF